MAGAIFPTVRVVRGNLTKPRDAEFSGRYHGNQPIYVEKKPVYSAKDVPILDQTGEPVYKTWNNGMRRLQTHRPIVGYVTREYVIEDLGNGITPKNYDFAPSKEELAHNAAVEATTPEALQHFVDKVNRVFKALNLDEADIAQLAGDTPEAE